ncbi:hypothetical protein K505DRAFT_195748, partial [Melanomma pulvis-pyrius CBS 109.77]
PIFPYHIGALFYARQHTPLLPSGRPYRVPLSPRPPDWKTYSKIECCLTRPPLGGTIDEEVHIALTITAEIRLGDEKGAQLVIVNGDMVAKIYDPLYYRSYEMFHRHYDVVREADTHYCREAASYNELLSSSLQGSNTPKYYGSWVIDVSLNELQDTPPRQVPLILMEHIDGICMRDIDPKALTEEERDNILIHALEVEAQVYHHGVHHQDFHPRNIMISYPQPSFYADFRPILIDFDLARVVRLNDRIPAKSKWSKMLSPAYRHWGQLGCFVALGWLPWNNGSGQEEWLWEKFGHDDRFVALRRNE